MPFLQLGYKRLHYTDSKPGDDDVRETFIFTPGLESSQNYYGAVVAGLTRHHFRCITFDTTGAGRSPYTQIEQSIESLSNDIIGLMDTLEVPKAVVISHSTGGIVAANLAAERNDRVVATITIGPMYPSNSIVEIFEKRIQAVEKEGMEPMANTIPAAATGKKASPIARAFIRELLLAQNPVSYISNCRVIANAKPPNYAKIAVPILILAGEEGISAPLEGCEKMFEQMGTGEKKMEILKGVGHWHCVEASEEVGKQILSFYHEIQ